MMVADHDDDDGDDLQISCISAIKFKCVVIVKYGRNMNGLLLVWAPRGGWSDATALVGLVN